jgi:hypothetical protein
VCLTTALRAIQIIRETQGDGGGEFEEVSHRLLLLFETLFLMLLEVKRFCYEAK